MDKVEAITEKKELETKLKQEAQTEADKEKKADAKADAAKGEKKEAKPEAKAERKEKKKKIVLERAVTIPMGDAHSQPRNSKSPKAMSLLRAYAKRHGKASRVVIEPEVSDAVVGRFKNPLKSIKVMLQKDEDGVLTVSLPKEKKA